MIYNTLFTFIILHVTVASVLSFINVPSSSIETQTSTTCLMTSHQPSLHSRYSRYSTPASTSVVVPPISMPVWSLSCPVSTLPSDSYLRSRMSILTYVTQVCKVLKSYICLIYVSSIYSLLSHLSYFTRIID